MSAAADHRQIAARFAEVIDGTTDWDAPSPVPEWQARDVVDHLVTWLPGFLAADGVVIEPGPTVADDPAAAWDHHARQVQALLDGPDRDFTHPQVGTRPLHQMLANFYTADVFMHTWDLARSSGQDAALDPDRCAAMLSGMEPMSDMLRASGQFGPVVDVPTDASAQDRLIAFIGRDPSWTPPA